MFEATVREAVLQLQRSDIRWLATGWDGGFRTADAAYNVSVPEGWDQTDLERYVADRRSRAEFDHPGPTLLTGVSLDHLAGARLDPVVAYATAGLSNPATLPQEPTGRTGSTTDSAPPPAGTINLVVGTTRSLDDGTLATMLGTVVEAKTATVQAATGFTGTTSDAVVVASDQEGEGADFAGSATTVGAAARACVRDAVRASLDSRYADRTVPDSVDAAEHGTETNRQATTFEP
jgi:adenosylcobinamide hydrolase